MSENYPDLGKMRIVFAGTPEFAANHLQALLDARANIVAVYTQPDRPAGRGKKMAPSPVKVVAQSASVTVLQPATLKDPQVQQQFSRLDADIFVVVAYGLIIPAPILSAPKYGSINVHASLLPRWRGAAPIQRAIEAGDRETGITIMQMDEGLDTGDMLANVRCEISPFETGGTLHDKLLKLGPPALISTLSAIARGNVHPEKQDDTLTCYAAKITKQEAQLDWRRPAVELEWQVRAFNPFPVTHTRLDGNQIRVWAAHATNKITQEPPGTIIAVNKNNVEVACGRQVLVIEEVQLAGKKRLPVEEVIRGNTELFCIGKRFAGIKQ